MIKKWSMSYPAVNGTEQRRAYVYLPTMYEAQPERRFPVLYMFDGRTCFSTKMPPTAKAGAWQIIWTIPTPR